MLENVEVIQEQQPQVVQCLLFRYFTEKQDLRLRRPIV